MKEIEINVGPLTNLYSLHQYIGPKIKLLRDAYLNGESPHVIWDASQLRVGHVSMSSLTVFLSIAHNISQFIGAPQRIIFDWKPDFLGFLKDIDFIPIANHLSIFKFDSERIGGMILGKTNPNTKILYYSHVLNENLSKNEIYSRKKILKANIRPNFNFRCNQIFKGLDQKLENTVSTTAIELIVNSLIHGKSVVFVGIQRTSKGITVVISDSGVGFPKSLKINFPELNISPNIKHSQGLLLGCLIQTKEHGIRLALNQILHLESILYKDILINDGWVVTASYDTLIRWQKSNWLNVLEKINDDNLLDSIMNPSSLLGPPINNVLSIHRKTGYWQKFENYLRGTRIIFEIPIR